MITRQQLADNRATINAWADDATADDMPERHIIRLRRLASEPGAATAQTARQWAEHLDDEFGEFSDMRNLASKLY